MSMATSQQLRQAKPTWAPSGSPFTGTYTSRDWEKLTRSWKLTLYVAFPDSSESADNSGDTYTVRPEKTNKK